MQLGLGIGIPLTPVAASMGAGQANRPTLDLNLLIALDPRVTFTRASSAAYFDSTGRLATASNDAPRFDYDPATPVGTVGPELVTNGDFSQGTSGWNAIQGGVLTAENGGLKIESTTTNYGAAQQLVTGLTSGKTYAVTCRARKGGAAPVWLLTSTGGVVTNNGIGSTVDTDYLFYTTCYSNQIGLTLQCQNVIGTTAYFDNISVKEVTFTPRGLLIEEQRTNLLLHSRDMTQAAWTKTDVTATRNQVGIDGTANSACLMTEGTLLTADLNQTSNVPAGSTITVSKVLKYGNCRWVRLMAVETTQVDGGQGWFDLQNGIKGTFSARGAGTNVSSTMTALGGGWYRCTVTATPNGTYTAARSGTNSASADNSTTRVANATYIVDCAQLEVGAFATSIITTGAATATRTADSAVMTGTNFSSWYNQTAGTIITEIIANNGRDQQIFNIKGPTGNIRNRKGLLDSGLFVIRDPASKDVTTANTSGDGSVTRIATAYAAADSAVVLNGGAAVTTAAYAPLGDMNAASIGNDSSLGAAFASGHIRRITYYPVRLGNSQLQALSAA